MASGKVLEETYTKWVQYKEDCVKAINSEPVPQGMEQFHSSCTFHEKKLKILTPDCAIFLFHILLYFLIFSRLVL